MSTFTVRGGAAPSSTRLAGAPVFRSSGRSFLLPLRAQVEMPTRYERRDKTMPERVAVARERLFQATPQVRY